MELLMGKGQTFFPTGRNFKKSKIEKKKEKLK
jgi:hypothetical protein